MNARCVLPGFVATLALVLFAEVNVTAQSPQPVAPAPGLQFAVDTFGGWEFDLADPMFDPDTGEPLGDTSGIATGANGTLSTGHRGEHVSVSVNGHASVRWQPALDNEIVPAYGGTFVLSSREGRRLSWAVAETVSYAPINALSFLPDVGSISAPAVDYQISSLNSLTSDTSAGVGFNLTRRGEISLGVGYSIVVEDGSEPDAEASSPGVSSGLRRWQAYGVYTHRLSRYLSVYGGYRHFADTNVDDAGTVNPQATENPHATIGTIEAGVNYERTLSFSRRTTLSFRTGTSAIDYGSGSREYQLVGNAALHHQIGRSWALRGAYDRSVRFVDVFSDPVSLDMFTINADGQLSRRTALQAFANYTTGSVGQDTPGNAIDHAWTSVQFRWALADKVALFSQYFYFQSELGALVPLPQDVEGAQRRHGIRVGLSFGTTLLGARR